MAQPLQSKVANFIDQFFLNVYWLLVGTSLFSNLYISFLQKSNRNMQAVTSSLGWVEKLTGHYILCLDSAVPANGPDVTEKAKHYFFT